MLALRTGSPCATHRFSRRAVMHGSRSATTAVPRASAAAADAKPAAALSPSAKSLVLVAGCAHVEVATRWLYLAPTLACLTRSSPPTPAGSSDAAFSLYLIALKPFKLPYSVHPLGTTLFVALTAASVATSQTLRGPVAAAARSATVLKARVAAAHNECKACGRYLHTHLNVPRAVQHAALSWLALFSLAAAQVAIFQQKELLGRAHLLTPHGQLGAATGLLFVGTLFAGGALLAAPKLFPKLVKARGLTDTVGVTMCFFTRPIFRFVISRTAPSATPHSCWWRPITRWRWRAATFRLWPGTRRFSLPCWPARLQSRSAASARPCCRSAPQ